MNHAERTQEALTAFDKLADAYNELDKAQRPPSEPKPNFDDLVTRAVAEFERKPRVEELSNLASKIKLFYADWRLYMTNEPKFLRIDRTPTASLWDRLEEAIKIRDKLEGRVNNAA